MTSTSTATRLTPLSLREKLGYGVGDFGFNLYWTTMASFLAAFYTDTFGLSAATAATMLFATKMVDACTDPVMGAIADRTETRFGKFRPYLLFAGVPMAILAWLAFSVPDLSGTAKILYAYVTYIMMMIGYTVLSTPYSALSGVMTARSQDRTSLISIRFIFAFGCGIFVNAFTFDLVEYFGDGDTARGWQWTIALYGLLATCVFWISFASTRERIKPPKNKTSVVQDLRDLIDNKPWLILFVLAMVIMMTITLRAGSAYYFFVYYLQRSDLLGEYLGVQMLFYLLGAASAPLMTRYLDKARLLLILMAAVAAFSFVFYWVSPPEHAGVLQIESGENREVSAHELVEFSPNADQSFRWYRVDTFLGLVPRYEEISRSDSSTMAIEGKMNVAVRVYEGEALIAESRYWPTAILLMFILNALVSFCLGPKSPLTWSMYADAADYTEWQKGRRATGMTFAAATFSQKLGGALGSAIMLWVLAYLGYEAKVAQSDASRQGIAFLQTAGPGIFAAIAVAVTWFYPLTGQRLDEIQAELVARESHE